MTEAGPLTNMLLACGSAVTHKDVLEHINDKDLAAVASQLREVIMHSTARGYTMDWSKQSGIPPTIPADIADQVLSSSAFIVVHGAGSFGHFQASRAGVHRGGLHLPLVTAGFVATRISKVFHLLEFLRFLVVGQLVKKSRYQNQTYYSNLLRHAIRYHK
ncbi:isopentenyl phosphate kinase isoform X3 [Nymphaea colorata]|uniref:isopentenyl phosphate kinase isoform X3 n=1 Tax=Nymphaea colorata TaxID=210225 RepID=UPI00214EBA0F|nr:isopentenyl phosphate kinase isoform X3 [Nymphaea colorata]